MARTRRALSADSARPRSRLPDHEFDGHGEPVNAIFELTCTCGNDVFVALGNDSVDDDDDEYRSPIAIDCVKCDARRLVFDERRDGYDPQMNPSDDDEDDDTSDLSGMAWGGLVAPYRMVIRYEYPSEHVGDPALIGREPELFSWVTILARTPSGELVTLFEQECA
jgi:hypothetical protein